MTGKHNKQEVLELGKELYVYPNYKIGMFCNGENYNSEKKSKANSTDCIIQIWFHDEPGVRYDVDVTNENVSVFEE